PRSTPFPYTTLFRSMIHLAFVQAIPFTILRKAIVGAVKLSLAEYPARVRRKIPYASFIPCDSAGPQVDNRHQNTYTPPKTHPRSDRKSTRLNSSHVA